VGILPYFPLAGGILTGKYKRGEAVPAGSRGERSPYVQKYLADETTFDKLEKLTAFATAHGYTLHELAFAWLLANERVSSVIAGATKPEQIVANAATIAWKLTTDEVIEVNGLL
jgi:aryl-alcohol dehydrogenase-like predicted oxidoreductase